MFDKMLKEAMEKASKKKEEIKTPMEKPLSPELIEEGKKIISETQEAMRKALKEAARLDSLKKRWWTMVEEYYDVWDKNLRFDPETGIVYVVTKKDGDDEDGK